MLAFSCCERCGEDDRDEGEESGDPGAVSEGIECSWQRADQADYCTNDSKVNSAEAVIGHGVQVSSDRQNVECLNEGVVQDEHDCRKPIRDVTVPEEHLANVCHIANLGVTKAKFPVLYVRWCIGYRPITVQLTRLSVRCTVRKLLEQQSR